MLSNGIKYWCLAILLGGSILFGGTLLANPESLARQSIDELAKQEEEKQQKAAEKAAAKLYNQARENYQRINYWQASVDLILILDFYPGYSRLEDVVFLLATCLYDMEMYDGANRMYRYLLRSVTKNGLVAESILGLQKVAYQKGEFQQSLKFYKALESHYTQHDGIYESRYYAEQTYFNMQRYNLVQNLLPHIKKKSRFYPFALYTSGLAHLKKKNVREAVADLSKIPRLSSGNPERRAILASAHLTLAYVYFELSDYEEAVKELAGILPDFHDYPEVLLTRAWALLKLEDYQGALVALNELCDKFEDYYNIEEAFFLRAQCYLKLGYYDFAVSEFSRVIQSSGNGGSTDLVESTRVVLREQEERLVTLQVDLLALETKLVTTIPLGGAGRVSQFVEEPDFLDRTRGQMIHDILQEREEFNRVSASILKLKKRAEKREMRKKWEAYAEYGKVRAMFLRETASQ